MTSAARPQTRLFRLPRLFPSFRPPGSGGQAPGRCSPFRKRALCLLPLFCCLALSACAGILDPGPPPTRLQLNPPMPAAYGGTPLPKQLVVAMPLAGRELDNDRIALVFHGREIRSLADARWTGSVPFLLQRHLIAAIQATGALEGVGDESAGIAANARLLADIREFSLHYTSEQAVPTAVLKVDLRLLDLYTGKVAAMRTFEAKSPASGKDSLALAGACERALGQGLAEAARWTVDAMRGL